MVNSTKGGGQFWQEVHSGHAGVGKAGTKREEKTNEKIRDEKKLPCFWALSIAAPLSKGRAPWKKIRFGQIKNPIPSKEIGSFPFPSIASSLLVEDDENNSRGNTKFLGWLNYAKNPKELSRKKRRKANMTIGPQKSRGKWSNIRYNIFSTLRRGFFSSGKMGASPLFSFAIFQAISTVKGVEYGKP